MLKVEHSSCDSPVLHLLESFLRHVCCSTLQYTWLLLSPHQLCIASELQGSGVAGVLATIFSGCASITHNYESVTKRKKMGFP